MCAWVFPYTHLTTNEGAALSSDCITLDFSAPSPGLVFDGGVGGVDRAYFATPSLYASWTGFVDPRGGFVAGYDVTLVTSNGTVIVDWQSVGDRTSFAFDGLTFTAGVGYVVGVRAVDRVGHVSVPSYSTGQVFDNTAPSAVVDPNPLFGSLAHISQREVAPKDGVPLYNEHFLSRDDHVLASCPVCLDAESGIGACCVPL